MPSDAQVGTVEGGQLAAVLHDPIVAFRENVKLGQADLALSRSDRALSEPVVRELPPQQLADHHARGILVTALRIAGLELEVVANYAAAAASTIRARRAIA
jgi:hypothetical protein